MMSDFVTAFARTSSEVSQLVVLDQITSTNAFVVEHETELPAFALVLSDHQTHGRGRMNRSWLGQKGETLAMSLVLPPQASAERGSLVPLLVGASLLTALCSHGIDNAQMKWPNDILVGGKKLAGVLCEILPTSVVVAGVGLNVSFLADAPAPQAVSLAKLGVVGWEAVDSIAAAWVRTVRDALDWPDDVRLSFVTKNLGTLGREIEVEYTSGLRWRGTAEKLRHNGALLVRAAEDNSLREVVAADVHHLYQ